MREINQNLLDMSADPITQPMTYMENCVRCVARHDTYIFGGRMYRICDRQCRNTNWTAINKEKIDSI